MLRAPAAFNRVVTAVFFLFLIALVGSFVLVFAGPQTDQEKTLFTVCTNVTTSTVGALVGLLTGKALT